MVRLPHAPCIVGLLLAIVPACSQPAPPRPISASVEQTADSLDRSDAPAEERRLHLAQLGVPRYHDAGSRGQGIKIAILDSGFRGYRHYLGQGLPERVKARSFRKDRNLEARDSQHGILCGEVVHALAPDAELLLANWEPDSPAAFLDAVRWAKNEGAKIVSCSLIMPIWSDGEGGGEVHRGLNHILGEGRSNGDLLCFASAGNTAQRHWCGAFDPNADGWHQWVDDTTVNTLIPWGQEHVAVELYGPTRTPFEVQVLERGSGELVGRGILRPDATGAAGHADVRFDPAPGCRYVVKVRCPDAQRAKSEAFHLVVLGGSLTATSWRGSIPFPGDGANVQAIGAVDGRNDRLFYSSCGPNSSVPKPDFVATVPFPSISGKRLLGGTSAAAPQAAGLAALVWSCHPDWTPARITQALRDAALDLGPPGHDCETGYGLLRLP